MKVIESGNSINFVDQNNVFVGYELNSQCCEWADWTIEDILLNSMVVFSYLKDKDSIYHDLDLEEYLFDKKFFKTMDNYDNDGGAMVIFRLISGDKEKYLYLFNVQNGYYGHGFTVKIDDKVVKEGLI